MPASLHGSQGASAVLRALLMAAAVQSLGSAASSLANDAPPANVTLYAEALCPYCAAFVTDTILPLMSGGFGEIMSFRYVAWGNAVRSKDGDVRCQHGPAECRLNRIINCATHLHPGQDAWLPFVACMEAAPSGKAEVWVGKCARKAGVDAAALHSCADGDQGAELESEAEAETAALHPPHRYVPWVVVNGIPLGDDYGNLWRYVCVADSGQRPEACYAPPSNRLLGSILASHSPQGSSSIA